MSGDRGCIQRIAVPLLVAAVVTGTPAGAQAGPVHFLLAAEAAPDPAGRFSASHVLVAEETGGGTAWSGDFLLQYALSDRWQVTADLASWNRESDHSRWRGVGVDILWCPHLPGDRPGHAVDLAVAAGPDERSLTVQGLLEHDPGPWILVAGAGTTLAWSDADGRRRAESGHLAVGAGRAVAPGWRVGCEGLLGSGHAPDGPWRGHAHLGLDLTRETRRWWITASLISGWSAGSRGNAWQTGLQAGVDF